MPTNFTLREIQEVCTDESIPLGLRFQLAYLGIGHHLAAGTVIGILREDPFPDVGGADTDLKEKTARADLKAKTALYAYSLCSGFHSHYDREPTAMEKLGATAASLGFANKSGLFAKTMSEMKAENPDAPKEEAQMRYIDLARRAADTIISRDASLADEEIDVESVKVKDAVKSNFDYAAIRSVREILDKARSETPKVKADSEVEETLVSREEAARLEAAKLATKFGQMTTGSSAGLSEESKDIISEDSTERVVVDAHSEGNTVAKPKPNL